MTKFPALKVNIGAIKENVVVMNTFCSAKGWRLQE